MEEIVTALENLEFTIRVCGVLIVAALVWMAINSERR